MMTNDVDQIPALFEAFDGRELGDLRSFAHTGPDFGQLQTALKACESSLAPVAATWVAKALVDAGRLVDANTATWLTSLLSGSPNWGTALHVFQTLHSWSTVPDPTALRAAAHDWLESPRPMMRAWSLDALVRLEGTALGRTSLIEMGLNDKSASVRARARSLSREFLLS